MRGGGRGGAVKVDTEGEAEEVEWLLRFNKTPDNEPNGRAFILVCFRFFRLFLFIYIKIKQISRIGIK